MTDQNPQREETIGQGVDLRTKPILVRRLSWQHMPNRKYLNYLLLTNGGELECYEEACQVKDASKWEFSMEDEMKSLVSN